MVYPNPAGERIYIRSDGDISSEVTISICDGTGKLLYLKKFPGLLENQGREIDLSNFTSGVYILQLRSSDGIRVKKIIKE